MKNLFEYLVSTIFAIALIVLAYSYFSASLIELTQTSLTPLTK